MDKQTGHIAFRTHRRDLIFAASQPKASLIYAVTRAGLVVALKPTLQPGSYGEIAELPPDHSSHRWMDGPLMSDDLVPVRRALLSVSDKTGLLEFASRWAMNSTSN